MLQFSINGSSERVESTGIDLFADTAAILISIVSNSYYGILRGQMHINLPPEHPIMSFETIEINMAKKGQSKKGKKVNLDPRALRFRARLKGHAQP